MLEFKELLIEDREKINKYLQLDGSIMSDRCFASLCIWGPQFNLKYALKDGFLYFVISREDSLSYYMPLGRGSLKEPLNNLRIDAEKRGIKHSVVLITEERLEEIQNLLGQDYEIRPDPNKEDYIYYAEKIINLSGKKLHSKRNFINRFKKEFEGRWSYRALDPFADRSEVGWLLNKWGDKKNEQNYKESYEYSAVRRALDNYSELSLRGGCLFLDGTMIAFTIGAPQNEKVMDILIEKADSEVTGSYQMINHEFALHECADYKYINREEDMGIEGLKKAKLSYMPAFMTKKYAADFKEK